MKLINREIINIDEDEYSGKIVITVDTIQTKRDMHIATMNELLANQYLYRDIPTDYKDIIIYHISLVAHFMDDDQFVVYSETANNVAEICEAISNCQMLCS